MVRFLSIFFPWISSILVRFFKGSRFFCVTLYQGWYLEETLRWSGSERDVRVGGTSALIQKVHISSRKQAVLAEISVVFFSVTRGRFQDSASNKATSTSFHIPSNSSLNKQPLIPPRII